ncbi:type VI secretion system baseplate subunit TssG [Legionella yabuuchiae]|uniref:type VI secretion system baseplate subunit TssG n=1 Tax=Legionella yabuuchiae TaxID=376727 RepID=UPI001055CA60|nr:type VI secretion system baseplate subunit TssG [Legionella yabuuchiae]
MDDRGLLSDDFFHTLLSQFKTSPPDKELTRISQKKLILKATPSLIFPERDVAEVREESNELIIACQFMGLYGVDSPLPTYFNELCLKEREGSDCLRAFLDGLSHRSYALLYLAWQAFRFEHQIGMIYGVEENYLAQSPGALIDYAQKGSLGHFTRMCRGILPGIELEIKECIPDWVKLTETQRLGEYYCLGETSLVGDQIYDNAGKIKLIIGPVGLKLALQFLPGGNLAHSLILAIKTTLLELVHFEFVFSIANEPSNWILGQSDILLSYNSILGVLHNDTYLLKIPGVQYSCLCS